MKNYVTPELNIEEFCSINILASSFEKPTNPTQGTDPYKIDKF